MLCQETVGRCFLSKQENNRTEQRHMRLQHNLQKGYQIIRAHEPFEPN